MSKCRKMLEGSGEGVEKLMSLIETQSRSGKRAQSGKTKWEC